MRSIYLTILLGVSLWAKSQGTIVDGGGNIVGIAKLSDTSGAFQTKWKCDTARLNIYTLFATFLTSINLKAPAASPAFTGTPTGITATHVGLPNVNNTSDANKPVSTAQQTALDLKANLASPTFAGTVVLPNSTVTNAMLAGSIDLTTKVTGVLPYANGGVGSTAATSATTGTMTVNMTTEIITITPTGACTFNGSGGIQGQRITFLVTTSGVSSFTLTWGTNYRTTSTLATGTTSARLFAVTFICTNGTQWVEIARTAAMP